MFDIEANAEDLRASRSVAETLSMAIGRIADAFCGIGDTIKEATPEPDEEEWSET
jgi:hypothetical protein